jgi:hypothetical protein
MSGKIVYDGSVGDFSLPSSFYDIHEWIADSYIDGEIGQNCTLVYPDEWTECDNCILDFATQRSSNIYKSGGPVSFPANTLCPRCNGEGRARIPRTEVIRMRVYWDRRSWIDIGFKIANSDGIAMCIGYMSDFHKMERANTIIANSDIAEHRTYECVREGEAKPYGFRNNRYFIQYIRRTGGGYNITA